MKVKILDIKGDKLVEAIIKKAVVADLFDKEKFPKFKWGEFERNVDEIFKLTIGDNILGLIWFYPSMLSGLVEINKIEVSIESFGHSKTYDYVAGCLIAFACQYALKYHLGKIMLYPLDVPRLQFISKYRMKVSRNYLLSDADNSKQLVNEYLLRK